MANQLMDTWESMCNTNTLQFSWVQMLADKLNLEQFGGMLGDATSFAHALCGLFALLYICNIVWKSWVNGGQIDLYKCLKPFAIGMSIMYFAYVAAAVDFLASGIGVVSQSFSDRCCEASREQFNNYAQMVCNNLSLVGNKEEGIDEQSATLLNTRNIELDEVDNQKKESSETYNESVLSKLGDISSLPEKIVSLFTQSLINGFQTICALLASIISCCVLCMGFIGKCIFYVIGPILFAMELIPGMEGRIAGWFKKYLTYSLYPCILNFVNGVLMILMVTMSSGFESGLGGLGAACLTHIVVGLIGAFMFMNVPSVANQIMDSASNALGGAGLLPATFVAKKTGDKVATGSSLRSATGKLFAAGTGGTSAAVQGAAQVGSDMGSMGKKMSSDSNYKGGGQS